MPRREKNKRLPQANNPSCKRWRVNIRLRIPLVARLEAGLQQKEAIKQCYPNKVTWSEWLKKSCKIELEDSRFLIEAFRHRSHCIQAPLSEQVSNLLNKYKRHQPGRCYLLHLVINNVPPDSPEEFNPQVLPVEPQQFEPMQPMQFGPVLAPMYAPQYPQPAHLAFPGKLTYLRGEPVFAFQGENFVIVDGAGYFQYGRETVRLIFPDPTEPVYRGPTLHWME